VSPLTPREMEVARLVAEDLTDKLIADILGISVHTVHEHLERIGKKLGTQKGRRSRRRVIARWVDQREPMPRPPAPVSSVA
jgi:DNA-binding NarL/FixJ family response regulator